MSSDSGNLITRLDAEWSEYQETREQLQNAGPEIEPRLLEAVGVGNSRVCERVGHLLAEMGQPGVEALKQVFQTAPTAAVEAVATGLSKIETPNDEITRLLVEAMAHPSRAVRIAAANANLPATAEVLRGRINTLASLTYDKAEIAQCVCKAPERLGSAANEPLLEAFCSEDERLRSEVLTWLRYIDDERVYRAYLQAMDDPSPMVRRLAIRWAPLGKGRQSGILESITGAASAVFRFFVFAAIGGAVVFAMFAAVIMLVAGWKWEAFWQFIVIGAMLGSLLRLFLAIPSWIRDHIQNSEEGP